MKDLARRIGKLQASTQSHVVTREGGRERSTYRFWAMEMEWTALHLVRGVEPSFSLDEVGAFITLDGRFALSTQRMDLQALMGPQTERLRESIPSERWHEFLDADEEAAELLGHLQSRADSFAVPEDFKQMEWAWTQDEADNFSGTLKPNALFIDADERESTRRLSYVLLHDAESLAWLSTLTRRREAYVGEGEG